MKSLIRREEQPPGFQPPVPFAAPEEQKMSDVWRRHWRVIWTRRWEILGVFVAVFTIFAVRAYRTQPVYTATGTIAIEPTRQQVIVGVQGFSPADQGAYEGVLIKMQVDILRSRRLAQRVINKMKLWTHPEFAIPAGTTPEERERQRTLLINAFLGRLEVASPRDVMGQRIIPVHFRSLDPHLAADVLNTLFESFINLNRESNIKAVEFAQDWLTEQLAELEGRLEKSKRKLLKFQRSTNLVYLSESEKNPTLEQFSALNAKLAQAKAARINAEILYRANRERNEEVLLASMNDPILDGLKQQRSQLEAKLAELRLVYQEDAPKVKELKHLLDDLDDRIERAKQTLLDRTLVTADDEYSMAKKREQTLSQEVERLRAEILKQNQDALEFSLLRQETQVDERLFQMLSERLHEAGLMRSLTPNTNIRVIDRAETPLVPSNSTRAGLVRGGLLGLILGVGLAFLLEFLDDSLKTVEEVETWIQLPSLGVIPLADGLGERPMLTRRRRREPRPIMLMTSDNGSPMFTEAYRTLRTSVLLSSATRPPRSIIVTSSEARAGKTTTALNIAIALAQAGKRVLLIDGDMRHPGCAQALGVDSAGGLSTYLSSGDEAAVVYHDCAVAGLDLLPSGPIPPNPSELLSSERTRDLIETMAAQYDHIIIDTPPLGLVSDALILSALVDGVILVARAEETSGRAILRVKESLRNVKARVLGVVLNAVDVRRHKYGYYDRDYGYGYYYYGGKKAGEVEEPNSGEGDEPPARQDKPRRD